MNGSMRNERRIDGKAQETAFVNAGDRIRALPKDRREHIEALAGVMASELHLAEIRKALSITQKTLPKIPDWPRAKFRDSRTPNLPVPRSERWNATSRHGRPSAASGRNAPMAQRLKSR